ncbi:MAG: hypothetical protein WA395_12075 [Nitrososphaeraceae archaeon]
MIFGDGNSNRQFLANQLLWLGISLGISITISILLPFPISLVTIIGVFIVLNLYMRRRVMQRMGMEGYGKLGIVDSEVAQNSSLKYYCMSCGTQHKDIECPKCGSKMKKVGF